MFQRWANPATSQLSHHLLQRIILDNEMMLTISHWIFQSWYVLLDHTPVLLKSPRYWMMLTWCPFLLDVWTRFVAVPRSLLEITCDHQYQSILVNPSPHGSISPSPHGSISPRIGVLYGWYLMWSRDGIVVRFTNNNVANSESLRPFSKSLALESIDSRGWGSIGNHYMIVNPPLPIIFYAEYY